MLSPVFGSLSATLRCLFVAFVPLLLGSLEPDSADDASRAERTRAERSGAEGRGEELAWHKP
eukprot:5076994-Pyramimonas_sp.AAC.2